MLSISSYEKAFICMNNPQVKHEEKVTLTALVTCDDLNAEFSVDDLIKLHACNDMTHEQIWDALDSLTRRSVLYCNGWDTYGFHPASCWLI